MFRFIDLFLVYLGRSILFVVLRGMEVKLNERILGGVIKVILLWNSKDNGWLC